MKNHFYHIFLFLVFLAVPYANSIGQSQPDSLVLLLGEKRDASEKIDISTKIAYYYLDSLNDVQKSKEYAWKAKDLSTNEGLEISVDLYLIIARLHGRLMTPYAGVEAAEMAIKAIPPGNITKLAEANNIKAYMLLHSGRFMNALNLYNENLKFCKINNLDQYIARAYLGLANTNGGIGNKTKEIFYAEKYLDKAIEIQDYEKIAEANFRLGEIYLHDSAFNLSEKYYILAFEAQKSLNDTGWMAFNLLRVAWVNYLDGKHNLAIKRFKEALKYSKIAKRPTSSTNALGNLGTIYRDIGEIDTALIYYKESLELSEEVKDYYNLSWVYKDMSDMLAANNDYVQAYEYFKLFKTYNDSLDNQRFRLGLEQARTLYEADKKQRDLQLMSVTLEQHRTFVYGLGAAIILLVIIAFLILRQTRLKSGKRISEMNHKISEITQQNLRQQMNPHFIFNTLNSIQYYMYQHDKLSTNQYLTKFSSLIRRTLENSRHTSISLKDELEALELYLELESIRFKNKFSYQISIDEEIDLIDHKIPTMLIQPYIENAIGHGLMHRDEGGILTIDLSLEDFCIACTIEDNGIGREAAMIIKQQKNGGHKSLGTTITESRLKLVNDFYGKKMRVEYTDLRNNQGEPAGTKVKIYIPIIT